MDLELGGLKALVTGRTKGIGAAIAQTLAREGAEFAICARHGDEVAQSVATLRTHGVNAYGADVGDPAALKAWVMPSGAAPGSSEIVVANDSALGHSELGGELAARLRCRHHGYGVARRAGDAEPGAKRPRFAQGVQL